MTTITRLAVAGLFLVAGCRQQDAGGGAGVARSLAAQSTPRIWVLDDADPDYSVGPFGDTLTLLDGQGASLAAWSDINEAESIGGWRAVSARAGYALVAEIAGGRLIRFDAASTTPTWIVEGTHYSVDVASDALAFVIKDAGTLGSGKLAAVDPGTGLQLVEYAFDGVDLVTDPARDVVWVTGARLYKVGFDGTLLATGPTFGWAGVSVDLRSDGSIWLVERAYSAGWGTDRLTHFDTAAAPVTSVALEHPPFAVATDPRDDAAWVASLDGTLTKFDATGVLLFEIPSPEGFLSSVVVDPSDGSAWVGGKDETVHHYAADGTPLHEVTGFAPHQKFLALSVVEETPPVIEPGDFRTWSQGGWGTTCHGGNPGCFRDASFAGIFPGGLRIGEGHTILLQTSAAVAAFLPQGRRPARLTADYVDPLATDGGVLAGQLLAAALNVGFDRALPGFGASDRELATLRVVDESSPCVGWSVAQVLLEGSRVLGGSGGTLSPSDVNECLAGVNEAFPDGGAPSGYLGY